MRKVVEQAKHYKEKKNLKREEHAPYILISFFSPPSYYSSMNGFHRCFHASRRSSFRRVHLPAVQ